jgi:6-phosphogluconate dehydrogenase
MMGTFKDEDAIAWAKAQKVDTDEDTDGDITGLPRTESEIDVFLNKTLRMVMRAGNRRKKHLIEMIKDQAGSKGALVYAAGELLFVRVGIATIQHYARSLERSSNVISVLTRLVKQVRKLDDYDDAIRSALNDAEREIEVSKQ